MTFPENGFEDDDVIETTPEQDLAFYKKHLGSIHVNFSRFMRGSSVGSARLMALSDVVEDWEAAQNLAECRQNYLKVTNKIPSRPEEKIHKYGHPAEYASSLRVAEHMATGVRLRMNERDATIPGYFTARNLINDWISDYCEYLGSAYDVVDKNPEFLSPPFKATDERESYLFMFKKQADFLKNPDRVRPSSGLMI